MSNQEWGGAEESRPNIALRDQIEHLAESNPTVHQALRLSRSRRCTYEESLQMAVIQLAAIASAHEKTLFEFAMRQPAPVLLAERAK